MLVLLFLLTVLPNGGAVGYNIQEALSTGMAAANLYSSSSQPAEARAAARSVPATVVFLCYLLIVSTVNFLPS